MRNILLGLFMLLLIVGCSSKDIKPYEVYSINSDKIVKQPLHVKKILRVVKIKSPAELQSDKIWYKESSVKIDAYFYSKWNSSFADMVEQNLVNSISSTKLFDATYARYSKTSADFTLESELVRAIHDVEKNEVSFALRAYLLKGKKLVSSSDFIYREKCASRDVKGAVKAYEMIIEKLNKDVVLWISKSVKEN